MSRLFQACPVKNYSKQLIMFPTVTSVVAAPAPAKANDTPPVRGTLKDHTNNPNAPPTALTQEPFTPPCKLYSSCKESS